MVEETGRNRMGVTASVCEGCFWFPYTDESMIPESTTGVNLLMAICSCGD